MKFKKIATAAATAAMITQAALPVFAATDLVISGNGSDSDQEIHVEQHTSTTVVQTNDTDVDNDIDVRANTGGNEADGNTGGGIYVETGDVTADVEVANQVNSNVAAVENCGACDGDTSVTIEGNGSDSSSHAGLHRESGVEVYQDNNADIDNDVDVKLNSGFNEADDNTGGDVVIATGDVDAKVKVHNAANSNSAMVAGSGDGGDVDLVISGNGSGSENGIELGLGRYTLLAQANVTDIDNDVDVKGNSGGNEADDNTGGEIAIGTGDVDVKVMVDNMAGFNHAYIDDCCHDDLFAKVSGNGEDSDNFIGAKLDQNMEVFQDNVCGKGWGWPMPWPGEGFDQKPHHHWWGWDRDCFDNDVDVKANTGDNAADDNTGEPGDDPMIITGDSDVEVEVDNMGGSNSYGSEMPGDWYDMWPAGGLNLSFSFSLSDLLGLLEV